MRCAKTYLFCVFFVVLIIVHMFANCIADIYTYCSWEIVHCMCVGITHGETTRWHGSPAGDIVHELHGFSSTISLKQGNTMILEGGNTDAEYLVQVTSHPSSL